MEDDELCERLERGEEQAFRDLFRRHHAHMVRLARAFVADRTAAEEVAQDTWLAVLTGIRGFERRSSLKSWIYAILANKARTRAGRDRRTLSLPDLAEERASGEHAVDPSRFDASGSWVDPPRLWHDLNPERVVAGQQLWAHAMRAIEDLPASQRAVIVMRDVEGQGSEETCSMLGLTEANQRVLLHRARARIRRVLEPLLAPR
jgi:RNA polymerase sigma-70 factor (ECF subfamily)